VLSGVGLIVIVWAAPIFAAAAGAAFAVLAPALAVGPSALVPV
jgi:hypothetical protein